MCYVLVDCRRLPRAVNRAQQTPLGFVVINQRPSLLLRTSASLRLHGLDVVVSTMNELYVWMKVANVVVLSVA